MDHWIQFLREQTTPIVKALQWFSFGHCQCTSEEYNVVYSEFKDNIKIINNSLKQKKYLVGDSITLADVYLTLTQVEMQQVLMDTNFKNSLQFFNAHFKHVTNDVPEFKSRMGIIKIGKKQITPQFIGQPEAEPKGAKDAKKAKAKK